MVLLEGGFQACDVNQWNCSTFDKNVCFLFFRHHTLLLLVLQPWYTFCWINMIVHRVTRQMFTMKESYPTSYKVGIDCTSTMQLIFRSTYISNISEISLTEHNLDTFSSRYCFIYDYYWLRSSTVLNVLTFSLGKCQSFQNRTWPKFVFHSFRY